MPLVTDPHGVVPAAPMTVTSPDGRLTAVLDGTHPGVWLKVSDQLARPPRWRITRRGPDGVDVLVRSADPVWSPSGTGVAYDDEAPLGVAVRYTATPEFDDGTAPAASVVTLTTGSPGVTPQRDVWISSIETPDRAALVCCTDWPTLTYTANSSSTRAIGSSFSVVSSDVHTAGASDMTLYAVGSEIEFLRDVLLSTDVLLVRTLPTLHRPDSFVTVGDVAETMLDVTRDKVSFGFSLTQVARPGTLNQRLRVPGWSNASVAAAFTSYGAVKAGFTSWLSLASNGVFTELGVDLALSALSADVYSVQGRNVAVNGDGTGTINDSRAVAVGDGTATITV